MEEVDEFFFGSQVEAALRAAEAHSPTSNFVLENGGSKAAQSIVKRHAWCTCIDICTCHQQSTNTTRFKSSRTCGDSSATLSRSSTNSVTAPKKPPGSSKHFLVDGSSGSSRGGFAVLSPVTCNTIIDLTCDIPLSLSPPVQPPQAALPAMPAAAPHSHIKSTSLSAASTPSGLNPEQWSAVSAPPQEPLLVLAGPGSGKTFTLQKRIARIIETTGCSPSAVLAITFTRSAAEELRSRVARDVGGASARSMFVGTFHSFAMRLCREFIDDIHSAGRSRDFLLAGTPEQVAVVRQAIELHEAKVAEQHSLQTPLPSAGAPPSYSQKDMPKLFGVGGDVEVEARRKRLSKRLVAYIAYHRSGSSGNEDTALPQLLLERGWPTVAWFIGFYDRALRDMNMLDFGELITFGLAVIQQLPSAREWVQSRFQYLLVDEFQDTSQVQFELVRTVGRILEGRVTAVGDDDQSIYGFQGACVGNFAAFQNAFVGFSSASSLEPVALCRNYRSTPAVVCACTGIIGRLKERRFEKSSRPVRKALRTVAVPAAASSPMLPEQLEDAVHGGTAVPPAVDLAEVMTGKLRVVKCETVACEVAELSDAIMRFRKAGYAPKDIAVLCRRRVVVQAMGKALKERGVPVRQAASAVFTRGDVRNAWAVLAACMNPHNDIAFLQALSGMLRGSKRPLSPGLVRALRQVAHCPSSHWYEVARTQLQQPEHDDSFDRPGNRSSGRRKHAVIACLSSSDDDSDGSDLLVLPARTMQASAAQGAKHQPTEKEMASSGSLLSLYDVLSIFAAAPREWRAEAAGDQDVQASGQAQSRIPLWDDVQQQVCATIVARHGTTCPAYGWPVRDTSLTRKAPRAGAGASCAASMAAVSACGPAAVVAVQACLAKVRAVHDALRGIDLDQFKLRVCKLEACSTERLQSDLVSFVEAAVSLLPFAKGNGFMATKAASRGASTTAQYRQQHSVRRSTGISPAVSGGESAGSAAATPPGRVLAGDNAERTCLVDAVTQAARDFLELWEEERVQLEAGSQPVPGAAGGTGSSRRAPRVNAFKALTAREALRGASVAENVAAERLHAFVNHVAQEMDGADFTRREQEKLSRQPAGGRKQRRGGRDTAEQDSVWCGTIHQSKGLEWGCVIVCRMNEGELPFSGGGSSDEAVTRQRLDEERRVAFVAMSRAKDHLVCTWLHRFSGGKQGAPSHFLEAVPAGLVSHVVRDNPAHAAHADCGASLHVPVSSLDGIKLVDARVSQATRAMSSTPMERFFKQQRGQ